MDKLQDAYSLTKSLIRRNSIIVPKLDKKGRVFAGFTLCESMCNNRILYRPDIIYGGYIDIDLFMIDMKSILPQVKSSERGLIEKQVNLIDTNQDLVEEYEEIVIYLAPYIGTVGNKSYDIMDACDRYIRLFEALVLESFRGIYKKLYTKELGWIGENSSFDIK